MRNYLAARDGDGKYHNLGLVAARQNTSGRVDHFFVTRLPTEMKTAESTRGSLTFPLYRYPVTDVEGQGQLQFGVERETTVSAEWARGVVTRTGLAFIPDGPGDLDEPMSAHIAPP